MVLLVAMTQEDLDAYLKHAVQSLADELRLANAWPEDESVAAANQSFDTALPGRSVSTKNQFLRVIVAGTQKVGILWFGFRGKQEAFVWDLLIYPTYREQGFARAAMLAMEQELREKGITRISLNLFAHNLSAAHLYETVGYRTVSKRMSKALI